MQDCTITLKGDSVHMAFDTPQRAVTAGQSAVFYDGEVCLGGAIVDTAETINAKEHAYDAEQADD